MPATLADTLTGILEVAADAEAVEFQGDWWTWGDLGAARRALYGARVAAGLTGDVRVGVMLRNRPECIAPVLDAVIGGDCLVTINPSYPDSRLIEDIARLRTPVLVAATSEWSRLAVAEAGLATGALCLEVTPTREVRVRQTLVAGRLDHLRARAPDVACEMLTSGTTGAPKRIPLAAANFEQAVMSALLFEAGRSGDEAPRLRSGVQLLMAPFAHIGGLMAMLNAIASGRRSCLLERFTVEGFHDAVKRHRPKVVATPPAALKMVLDAAPPREDLASLAVWRTGTAPLDPELADAFYEAYGVPVLQNYGATEFGGVAGWTLQDFQAHRSTRRGAVGRLNPGIEGRVVDPETGQPLPAGVQGVLELRGAQVGDGSSWLRTTDLAVLDEERFLWIKGRADNVILRGGFKIQPEDIVSALEAHPAVREAAVVALPDARLGQVPAAACVLKAGAQAPSERDLIAFVRERLLPYQAPVRVMLLAELPRTDSMKVSQPQLRALFAEQPVA